MLLRIITRSAAKAEAMRLVAAANPKYSLWSPEEHAVLLTTKGKPLGSVLHLFPKRTRSAVMQRRQRFNCAGPKPRSWTKAETARLREAAKSNALTEIALSIPTRTAQAVRMRAQRMGVTYPRPQLKMRGEPIYDEIRMRVWEDGISLRALNEELNTHGYFTRWRKWPRPLHLKYVAIALDFFGARLRRDGSIDWQDE